MTERTTNGSTPRVSNANESLAARCRMMADANLSRIAPEQSHPFVALMFEAADALDQSTVQETIRVLNVKLSQVAAENDRLRAALEWYANQNQYAVTGPHGAIRAQQDRGQRARTALQGSEGDAND